MIIYENTINNFLEDIKVPDVLVSKLVAQMRDKIGYSVGKKEKDSWRTTLCSTEKIFKFISPKSDQYILLEFKIPNTRKRIDVIVAGNNGSKNNLFILELKGWSQLSLSKDSKLLSINTQYRVGEHPAYEALDYVKILKNQYSSIVKYFSINGAAWLPNYSSVDNCPLENKMYNDVNSIINTYTNSNEYKMVNLFKDKFNSKIDYKYIKKLSGLEYKPSKTFLKHLQNSFEEIELLGSQRIAFTIIQELINKSILNNKKTLITVSGAAGSGKTIVAFKVLGYLLTLQKNPKLMLPGPEFRQAVIAEFGKNIISEFIGGAYSKSESEFIVIDEAHKATGQGTAGAFYDQLLKKAGFLICLIDDLQVINKKGITKEELNNKASKNNFEIINIDLHEQFRNGGDATYTEWLKNWIFSRDNNQEEFVQNYYVFEVCDNVQFNKLYKEMYEKHNVRLISFWTQTWDIDRLIDDLPNRNINIGGEWYAWNPNWQWLDLFKRKNPDVKISTKLNNLCNTKNFITDKMGYEYVGYFNTVQGSEFDYAFVHIPKLFYLNDKGTIDVDLSKLEKREMASQIWATSNIKDDKERERKETLNKKYFLNRLFVNLTRGTKGCYIFVEDKKLEQYIKEKVHRSKLEK